MKHIDKLVAFPDDVDRIVDRMIAHPGEVEQLKDELRRKISETPAVAKPCGYERTSPEPDDPWDNMPV